MKLVTRHVLLSSLLIAAAGVAWAGRPAAVDPEPMPAEATTAAAVKLPAVTAPEAQAETCGEAGTDEGLTTGSPGDLQYAGADCVADCRAQYTACKSSVCNYNPTCIQQVCYPQFVSCAGQC